MKTVLFFLLSLFRVPIVSLASDCSYCSYGSCFVHGSYCSYSVLLFHFIYCSYIVLLVLFMVLIVHKYIVHILFIYCSYGCCWSRQSQEVCPKCGTLYLADAKYCRACGHKRGEAGEAQAMPPFRWNPTCLENDVKP